MPQSSDSSLIRDWRSAVFLATKYGITRTPEGALKIDNRPDSIRASCNASLQRLGIERIEVPRFQEGSVGHNAGVADLIKEFARRKNCTAAQLALAWVLAQGALAIPGMKTRGLLKENVGALSVTLTRAEQKELNSQIEAITVRGDRHAPPMRKVLDG